MNSGKNTNNILHETLHLVGLSDRYNQDATSPNFGKPHKNNSNDIMGTNGKTKISLNHYKNIKAFALSETKNKTYLQKHNKYHSQFLFGNRTYDINENGTLKRWNKY